MAASPHDHSPPSPAGSSASDGSSNSTAPPQTPGSTSPPFAMPTFMNFTSEDTLNGNPSLSAGGAKRPSKTTRRINTAERRATHNAVERQRRENLNGRFLVCGFYSYFHFVTHVYIFSAGPRCSAFQPESNTSAIQVGHRQLVHRTSECVAQTSHPRRTATPDAEGRGRLPAP
jgi:hypothetical protein